jgi:WD40 repeat protein
VSDPALPKSTSQSLRSVLLAVLLSGSPWRAASVTKAADAATRPALPATAPTNDVRLLLDHKDIVWSVAFSPDGRFLASGGGGEVHQSRPGDFLNVTWAPGSDFALRVWDVRTGKIVRCLVGHRALVACVAWSPDGKLLLSGSDDSTLRLWDAETGKEVRRFDGHTQAVVAAVFSADGSRVLSGSRDQTVRLWDVKTGKELRRFAWPGGRVWDVALSRDGTRAAVGGDANFALIWDATTGRELHRLTGHTEAVVRVAFSSDGGRLLTGSWDRRVRLWDAATGEVLRTFEGHTDRVEGVAFSPDGRRLLTGSLDQTVRLWDAITGKELHKFEGHEAPVSRVAFAPDGRTAASAGWDRSVRLWRLPSAYDPVLARQVFPEAYQPPEKLAAAVRRHLVLLDSPSYSAREEAAIVLRELGDEIVPLLLRLDPATLTPEQASRVSRLLAGRSRLTAKQVTGLRDDRSFLLDCLEADEAPVRQAALMRLREVTKAEGLAVEFDPDAPPDARRSALEKLRRRLLNAAGTSD